MWVAYIDSAEHGLFRELGNIETEAEARLCAEREATSFFGAGWKADYQTFEIKITLYKVEKEITVFERE